MEDNGWAPASCEPSVAEDGRRPCSETGEGGLDLGLQVHGSERPHMDCSFDFFFSVKTIRFVSAVFPEFLVHIASA
jgi:hypothetical protein